MYSRLVKRPGFFVRGTAGDTPTILETLFEVLRSRIMTELLKYVKKARHVHIL